MTITPMPAPIQALTVRCVDHPWGCGRKHASACRGPVRSIENGSVHVRRGRADEQSDDDEGGSAVGDRCKHDAESDVVRDLGSELELGDQRIEPRSDDCQVDHAEQ